MRWSEQNTEGEIERVRARNRERKSNRKKGSERGSERGREFVGRLATVDDNKQKQRLRGRRKEKEGKAQWNT